MPGYSCVPAVNARCVSARTVTGASSTAVRGVPVLPGVSRYARPAPVTSKRGAAATATPSARDAIGPGAENTLDEKK